MSPRHDMYRNVHKGLRRTLCTLVADAGAADANATAQAAIAERWQAAAALLAAHHHHEDTFIGPHLARHAPALFAQMEGEHAALAARTLALTDAARALRVARQDALAASALSFYRLLADFVGHYLSHMAQEEGPYLSALQAAYDDARLAQIEGELLASIAPATMGAFLAQMLPAMSGDERLFMLQDMREHAPPGAYEGACALAEQVLEQAAFRSLQRELTAASKVVSHG